MRASFLLDLRTQSSPSHLKVCISLYRYALDFFRKFIEIISVASGNEMNWQKVRLLIFFTKGIFLYTASSAARLDYNDHGYNEFTAMT